jgi:peptide/nickel transport system substrate-binding protein
MQVRIVAIIGVAVAAVTLSLDAASGAGRTREGGTFRVVAPGLFNTIDPALASTLPEVSSLRPACAGLLAFPHKPLPAGLQVVPDLAEARPVVSRNGKTYTFTIRKDARFSNGARVTARDFVRALERIFDPAMKSSLVPYFESIAGVSAVLEGKATRVAGAVARGRTLILRLTRRSPDFPVLLADRPSLCAVPASLPADPEGAKAPLPSPAPYYVAEYVPGERVVLERNRFYRGPRPHHVDRFLVDLDADISSAYDQVLSGEADYAFGPPSYLGERAGDLARRYGVNKSRFFVNPAPGVRMFALNTSRPLFRGNVKLRQAVNFAVDRSALTRELGLHAGTVSDQYLPTTMPGFRNERIYPLGRPDVRRARALAAGRTRSGKAVLYTHNLPVDAAQAEILRRNLRTIGLELEVEQLARDAAPAIPYGVPNELTLVSAKTGCVVLNPFLDLTAVCLK